MQLFILVAYIVLVAYSLVSAGWGRSLRKSRPVKARYLPGQGSLCPCRNSRRVAPPAPQPSAPSPAPPAQLPQPSSIKVVSVSLALVHLVMNAI